MSDTILKYKDNEYRVRPLTLGMKPVWNKILFAINKQKSNFISDEDLSTVRDYEKRISQLEYDKELALVNCKMADILSPTEADQKKLNDYVKVHDEIDIKLNELKEEKLNNETVRVELENYSLGIMLAIDNALLEKGNEKIYESVKELLEGDVSKLDLTDKTCCK